MKKRLLVLITVSLIGIYGCNKEKKEVVKAKIERTIKKKSDVEVKTDIDTLLRKLNTSWNEMMASDDQKIESLQMLIAKIGKEKKFNKQQFTQLIIANDSLKTKRFTREALATKGSVNAYDAATDSLLRNTNQVAEASNLYLKDTASARLWDRIQQQDYRIPFFRSNYDELAKEYNQNLKDYQPQIRKLGPPYSELKPVPTFAEQLQ